LDDVDKFEAALESKSWAALSSVAVVDVAEDVDVATWAATFHTWNLWQ